MQGPRELFQRWHLDASARPLDVETLRGDFSCLSRRVNKMPPIYLDNACMTLKPRHVRESMEAYYAQHPSCHNRAFHTFGRETTAAYNSARSAVQRHINARDASEVVFTRNATEAINLVAAGLTFQRGDVVVTSDLEHNSNLLPWQRLAAAGDISWMRFAIPPDADGSDLGELERLLTHQPVALVSVFHTSHVTGITLPVNAISKLAHAHGALVLLDATQALPHHRLDVMELDVDYMALSFHKAYGPSGMGALYGRKERLEALRPLLLGGETVDDVDYGECVLAPVPQRFEAGLQNYAGAIGAAAALEYAGRIGLDRIRSHEHGLNEFLSAELRSRPRIRVLGPVAAHKRGAILNIVMAGLDSRDLARLLDQSRNIMVRGGVHCCHAWYRKYDLPPSLRLSVGPYNTIQEASVVAATFAQMAASF